MPGRLAYGTRYRYPHMLPEETDIWQRFMEKNPGRYDSVDYDFRVGSGAPVPPGEDKNQARMITMLSQKRIDVLAWVGEQPTIIELKRRVGLGTMGQVIGYKKLFTKYFPAFPVPHTLVICESISEDDRYVVEGAGIRVVEV